MNILVVGNSEYCGRTTFTAKPELYGLSCSVEGAEGGEREQAKGHCKGFELV